MKKIYLLLILVFTSINFKSQLSENQHIKSEDGQLLPSKVDYCTGRTFKLKTDAQATGTGNYSISRVEHTNFPLNAGGENILFDNSNVVANDNKFSEAINLGFPFSFYGKTYHKVSVGIHGRLVLNDDITPNLRNKTLYTDRTFTGNSGSPSKEILPTQAYNKVHLSNPNQETPLGQVFFSYTDLATSSTTSTRRTYRRVVHEGQHGLLISFTQATFPDYNGAFDAHTLLLEDGRIVIFIANKRRSNVNAILGIQNESGTRFLVPEHQEASSSNYNNGEWKSEEEAFVFNPNQNLNPVIKWFVNGIEVHEGQNYHFTPQAENEELKVQIAYFDDNGIQVGSTESSQVKFKKIAQVKTSLTANTGCGSGYTLSIANPNNELTYQWLKDNVPYAEGTSILVNSTGTYHAQVKDCENSRSEAIPVSITSGIPDIPFENGKKFYLCDTDHTPTKNINLLQLTNYPTGNYQIQFIDESTNSVTADSDNGYTLNITSEVPRFLSMKVSDGSGCIITRTFELHYRSFPKPGQTFDSSKICENQSLYTAENLLNDIGMSQDLNVKFSINGTDFHLDTIDLSSEITSPVYFQLSHADFSCSANYVLNILFHDPIEIKPITPFPPHCFSSVEVFDLNQTKQELEYAPNIRARFYKDSELSNEITNLQYRGSGKVYIKVENIETGCIFPKIEMINLIIYPKPQLKTYEPQRKTSTCGTSIYNLTTAIEDYLENWSYHSEIRYFDGSHIQLSQTEWENYDASQRGNPYMIFVYNSTNNLECSDRIEFDLVEIKQPLSAVSQIGVCDETTYPLALFLEKVISHPSEYLFIHENGTPIDHDFILSSLPLEVRFYIEDKRTGCRSDLQVVTFHKLTPLPLINPMPSLENCDTEGSPFDGYTIFNLTDSKRQISTQEGAIFTFYKNPERTLKIENPQVFGSLTTSVYVLVEVPNFCPSFVEIRLTVKSATPSGSLQDKYHICYGSKIRVDAGSENNSYQWSHGATEQIEILEQPGNYSVTLINTEGCQYTHHFVISDENQPKILNIHQDESKIEVTAIGLYPIEYSFNGSPYTSSNILLNPQDQEYHIRIRSALPDGSFCEGEPKELYNINIPNVLTPNGDGKNDVWSIKNLEKMEDIQVTIVDRYGKKVFHSTNKNHLSWDGKIQGRELSTGTYWYVVSWFDPSLKKNINRTGWILLKHRE